jgi:hypothetical protein
MRRCGQITGLSVTDLGASTSAGSGGHGCPYPNSSKTNYVSMRRVNANRGPQNESELREDGQ